MPFFYFGTNSASWAFGNEVGSVDENLHGAFSQDWNAIGNKTFDRSYIGSQVSWLSAGGDSSYCVAKNDNALLTNRGDLIEALRRHQGGTLLKHVSFSPYGAWVAIFEDATILLSTRGRFPGSFYELVTPYLDTSAARASRQRSKVSFVFFGASESVVVQLDDNIITRDISPNLAMELGEMALFHRLGRNTALSPIHKTQYFLDVRRYGEHDRDLMHISPYRYSLPPSPLLSADLLQAMLSGNRPPESTIQKIRLGGSLGQLRVPDELRPTFLNLFQKNANGKGYLTALEAAELFATAASDRAHVSYVFDLADIKLKAQRSYDEATFAQAMWFLTRLQSARIQNAGKRNDSSHRADPGQKIRWCSGISIILCHCCSVMIEQGESLRWCGICENGNYDLCEYCFESGNQKCSHEMTRLWVVKRPESPFRWTPGWIICTNCRIALQPGELCYWCKDCRHGKLDLCHECHSKRAYDCSHFPLPLCIIRKSTPLRAGDILAVKSSAEKTGRDSQSNKLKESLKDSIITEKPDVKWEDVAGLKNAKQEVQEAVIFPVRFPQMYQGRRKARGAILLFGPPGTGKSYLAKAVATECDSTLFSVSSSDLTSKWMGESEGLVRSLFQLARENKPSIIFIDEIDALAGRRDGASASGENTVRMKTEFLVQMDGLGNDNEGVLILAATNLPWSLDPAVRRRFQKRIYIPLPDMAARKQLFQIRARGEFATELQDEDFEELARRTEGFSGSDINIAYQDALGVPIKKVQTATHFQCIYAEDGVWYTPCEPDVSGALPMTWRDVPPPKMKAPPSIPDDFFTVLGRVKPSVGPEDIKRCYEWAQEYGLEGA